MQRPCNDLQRPWALLDTSQLADFIATLPNELAILILAFVEDIQTVACVSKTWYSLSMDNAVWHAQYIRRFGLSRTQKERYYIPRNWHSLFQQRLRLNDNWYNGYVEAKYFTGHQDSVYCIQYDSKKIVSGSRDRSIKFWDVKTRECFRTLTGHNGSVLCLQYDDRYIISGSSDFTAVIWDMETGERRHTLEGHTHPVLDIRFNQTVAATCSKDFMIKIWHLETGNLLRTLEGHRGAVNAIDMHEHLLFIGHTRGLACVQFDGNIVISGSNDRSIRVWDAHTGESRLTLLAHTDLVRTLCFDTQHLVSGSYDQSIKVWDMKRGELMLDLKDAHQSWVFHVQIDPTKIISASQDRKIIVWDFTNGEDMDDFL
ncbi:quinon protein alcohol dehydrogenase-like superfamily [Entophlyctis helioformis]|nr:quinon protein alcohol dehydrogenase-like superfamily [Entophlyctis helioformis]